MGPLDVVGSGFRNEQLVWSACMRAKSLQSCPRNFATFWTGALLPGSSVHGISQARILECDALLQGNPSNPGIELMSPVSPALAALFFTAEMPGKLPMWFSMVQIETETSLRSIYQVMLCQNTNNILVENKQILPHKMKT